MSKDEATLDLRERIGTITDHEPHPMVIQALGSIMSQAIADCSDTVEDAQYIAAEMGRSIAADIAKNWHLVAARRARG